MEDKAWHIGVLFILGMFLFLGIWLLLFIPIMVVPIIISRNIILFDITIIWIIVMNVFLVLATGTMFFSELRKAIKDFEIKMS